MTNYFESPFKGIPLDRQVTHPNIIVGRYSYYSGYYHGHSFDDCARYLLAGEDADRLLIGAFCSIGSGASFIMAGNQGHRNDWISTFPFAFVPEAPEFATASNGFLAAGDTVIGNDVWLASGCTILSGVKVGDGAVVAARAVVTRDVAPYAIVAGNPASVINWRFDEPSRLAILASQWWTWPEAEIRQIVPLLCSGKLDEFIAYAAARPGR